MHGTGGALEETRLDRHKCGGRFCGVHEEEP
jgi:hypothetical protein